MSRLVQVLVCVFTAAQYLTRCFRLEEVFSLALKAGWSAHKGSKRHRHSSEGWFCDEAMLCFGCLLRLDAPKKALVRALKWSRSLFVVCLCSFFVVESWNQSRFRQGPWDFVCACWWQDPPPFIRVAREEPGFIRETRWQLQIISCSILYSQRFGIHGNTLQECNPKLLCGYCAAGRYAGFLGRLATGSSPLRYSRRCTLALPHGGSQRFAFWGWQLLGWAGLSKGRTGFAWIGINNWRLSETSTRFM